MPKKISSEVDMNILMDISLGLKNKDIAVNYNVSPSYVSKVKRGKKLMNISLTPQETEVELDAVTFLKNQIDIREQELKIYNYILKLIKENNYAR